MRSGGQAQDRFHRQDLPTVSAGDLLPTAGIIIAVKRAAAAACAERASACAWPDLDAAKAWIDLVPLVAFAALAELCPVVMIGRLARCVGLDPLDGPDALAARREMPTWPAVANAIDAVVRDCGAGR
jgi:hypothetical protein